MQGGGSDRTDFFCHEQHPDTKQLDKIRSLVPSKRNIGIFRKVVEGRPTTRSYIEEYVKFEATDAKGGRRPITQPTHVALMILEKHPEIVNMCIPDDSRVLHSSATANSGTAGGFMDALRYGYGIQTRMDNPKWTVISVATNTGKIGVANIWPFSKTRVYYDPEAGDFEAIGRDLQRQFAAIKPKQTYDVMFNHGCISQQTWYNYPDDTKKRRKKKLHQLDKHVIETFDELPDTKDTPIGDTQHNHEWGHSIDVAMATDCVRRLRKGGHATTKIRRFVSPYTHILAGLFSSLFERVAIYPISIQLCVYVVVVGECAKYDLDDPFRLEIIMSMEALHTRGPLALSYVDTRLLYPHVMKLVAAVAREMEWDAMRAAWMTHLLMIKRMRGEVITEQDIIYNFTNNEQEQESVRYVSMRREMVNSHGFLQSINAMSYSADEVMRFRILLSRIKFGKTLSFGLLGEPPTKEEVDDYVARNERV